MNKDALAVLASRLSFVKERWQLLLADEPHRSPLGRQETVGFLVDATFMQLMRGLQPADGIPWLAHCSTVIAPLHLYLNCGLSTVRRYFAFGEDSLRAGAAEALGKDFDEVLATFGVLARHEIEMLCGACEHSSWPDCELQRPSPPDPPPVL